MLKVLKSGFFTTIQDAGRFGYLNKGVPVAGYMDSFSASKLNKLLDNKIEAAVMEITMTGPTLLFEEPTYVCLGGADISVTLNNNPIEQYRVYKIIKGDIISYGRLKKGFRNYLAIKNGFKTPMVIGSRSFYYPLTDKSHLGDQSELVYEACENYNAKISELKVDSFLDEKILHVAIGPEFELLNDRQLEQLFAKNFTVAKDYNRMAYQLEQTIEGHSHSMLTSATLPGTIQITPSGKLIVLMKDGQTTGGYPRILQLSDKAISILAQKKYGDTISFKLVRLNT
ncbi:biotin-dependent carboxyltransferase family protein [Maribacter algarum]|uniref:Biotin-dependent carboxyltransferase family protein n=1 Tax=Maribacter algarum (ex Zhang et al. 2020) TaxID=2578118 RepID=A0A5S3PT81_9FLAO|nr:biotin-dependent carboxyltransferase family protein [Maribacter algarum]TMM57123.1 biotin-dependent carboxyltransferase family protein [Maribacter algarum]